MTRLNTAAAVVRANMVQGWMRNAELRWLYQQAAALRPGARWVEVGTWKGKSACAVVHGLPPGAVFTAVDTWRGNENKRGPGEACHEATLPTDPVFAAWTQRVAELRMERPDVSIATVRATSLAAASNLRALGEEHDVVFIDGDHRYEPVLADIKAFSPLVAAGGLLCGHDYSNAEVRRAVVELLPGARHAGPGTDIWQVRL